MKYINEKYLDTDSFKQKYARNDPFPHIVFDNFIDKNLIENIFLEFPNLEDLKGHITFQNQREIKLASRGSRHLSPAAKLLLGYLNSDVFLKYLQSLTNIEETLVSDPYLEGGGYHETKKNGLLEVHVDFNKHFFIDLDRRVNLLLYLNKNWESKWGGCLELYNKNNLKTPVKSIDPIFNRCVIFNTTSESYHGHPKPLICPKSVSRKSIALYYYSVGRPYNERNEVHSTIFRPPLGKNPNRYLNRIKKILKLFVPPIVLKLKNKIIS